MMTLDSSVPDIDSTQTTNPNMKLGTIFSLGPIIPILTIHKWEDAIPLVSALRAGGIQGVEITLRTPIALAVIESLRQALPEVIIGAGTVNTPEQLEQSVNAGAQFAFSPGSTQRLLDAGAKSSIPFIPGVSSISECMNAIQFGYQYFKFFPAAELEEGTLKAWYGPFPQLRFCATGGLHASNFLKYLMLPNVVCVGGTWMVPESALVQQDWNKVTQLCHEALGLIQAMEKSV